MGRSYEVVSWHTNSFQPYIKVRVGSLGRQTRPRIKTWINTGIMPIDLIEQHLLVGEGGFISECQMQITEKVEGYVDQTGTFYAYQELRQRNPNMRPRQRNFRTSGVLICIKDQWFKNGGVKQQLANWILDIFCREYSVLLQDIGAAATNIVVRSQDSGGLRGDCIVLFDQTYGSLRFTEKLFLGFHSILERLRISAESENDIEKLQYMKQLETAYNDFKPPIMREIIHGEETPPPDCIPVFKPKSIVYFREKGSIGTDVKIITPTWMNGKLMYQIQVMAKPPAKRWVSADNVEPSANADEWEYGLWNAKTEEFVES